MQRLELKIPPLAVFLVCGVVMWMAAKEVPVAAVSVPAAGVVAAMLAATGAALGATALMTFRRNATTVHPTYPERSTAIVTTGVYRYTRNPMYLGLAMFLAAWAAWLGNLVALACLPVFIAYMTRFQIKPEERALQAKFGPSFADYMNAVRRWL